MKVLSIQFRFCCKLTLILFRAPDGLDGVIICLGDTTVVALEIGDDLAQIRAQMRHAAQEQPDEQQGPEQRGDASIESPEQSGWRAAGFFSPPLERDREKNREQRAAEEKGEERLNVGQVAGATQ